MNLIATQWKDFESGLKIEVANIDSDGNFLFAVRNSFGDVINKSGEFEHEPLPSARDDDFIKRCRYTTFNEAANQLENAL